MAHTRTALTESGAPPPAAGADDTGETERALRETVEALRAALEAAAAARSTEIQIAVQAERQANAAEVAELRALSDTLRVRIDELVVRHGDDLAAAAREFASERAELTATITLLRERLEEQARG